MIGTIADVSSSCAITSAAVNEYTTTPENSANVRHTIGASRNRFSRGVNAVEPNCTTRNSSENTIPMNVVVAAPTAISSSIARLVGISNPTPMRGAPNASAIAIATASSCTIPARSRRRRRSTRNVGDCLTESVCGALIGPAVARASGARPLLARHRDPQPLLRADQVVDVGRGGVDVDLDPLDPAGERAVPRAVIVADWRGAVAADIRRLVHREQKGLRSLEPTLPDLAPVEVQRHHPALPQPATVVAELHPHLMLARPDRLPARHLHTLQAEQVVAVHRPAVLEVQAPAAERAALRDDHPFSA